MKNYTSIKILFSFLLFCQFSNAQVDVVYTDLVWSDEFNTAGPVDNTNWFHQTQLPGGTGWFNGELQHYTNLVGNSYVDNGLLHIVAKREQYTDQGVTKQFTSARLNSKFAFKYGRVDVRAKLPIDAGTWPAIWMLGKNVNEDGGYFDANFGTTDWPACGETDIMERGIFPSQSVNYIQGTLHTPSSYGNSVNNGGTLASDLANSYHVYSVNWSPFQISFLLDNVVFYTYNPTVKNPSNWPFDKEQYLLLNIAMGGIAGNFDSNFTQTSMDIDYVRVYQNTLVDNERPDNFTASIGAVTSSSVELLLNATDNSGTVVYNVSYGTQSIISAATSGVQKSVIISGLLPNTNYNFSVAASDITGNTALNNPITLSATTSGVLGCSGTDTQSQQGTFTIGYNYAFETIGTDVKISFNLLDTGRVGLVAFLWKQTPFTETQMTNVSGNLFTKTITGQTLGTTIYYAVKFAFAGGLSVTKYISYVVGSNCNLGTEIATPQMEIFFPNPVHNLLSIKSNLVIDRVEVYNLLGKKVLSTPYWENIDVSNLSAGVYVVRVYSGTNKTVKKIVIN